jgi:iron complex outermembrane receptor protein
MLCFPISLMAAAPADLTRLSLEDLMDIPVFGASKYEQRIANAPASVTIVTADDIQKYGYRTLSELLRSVPGFYVSYDRAYSYSGIRGFGQTGNYNTRILIQLDGHRVNDNIYNQGFIGTESIIDLDLVDKVEIIRGPGSSLYGSNAFFGVINIHTKKTKDFGQPGAAVSYGSFDTLKGRLSYGRQFESGADLAISGSSLYSKGQDLYFPEFDDPASGASGTARNCDSDQAGNLFGRLKYGHLTLEGARMVRDKTTPNAAYGTDFNNPNSLTVDENWYLDLNYHHTVLQNTDITARLFFDDYRYKGNYIYDGLLNQDKSHGQYWGSEFIVSKPFFANTHRVTAGAEFIDNIRQQQSNIDFDPYVSNLDSSESNQKWAIYVQDEYRVAPWLLINAGLRQDHYPSFGDSLNPRLAFIFQPQERSTLKLIYGTAFRAPNAFELYYDDGKTTQRPQHLEPEKITSYEAVLEHRLFSDYRLTATGFHYMIEGLIGQAVDPSTELLVFQNLDKVTADGFEIELEGVWDNGLRGNISYSFQDVKNDLSGERLENSPQHIGKLNLIVPVFSNNWFLSSNMQYLSPRKMVDGSDSDAVWSVNSTLLGRNILKGLDISLSGFNLLNQKTKDPVGLEFRQNGIEQDGFGFLVKLAYTY